MSGQGIHRPQSAQYWHDLYKEQRAHAEALAEALEALAQRCKFIFPDHESEDTHLDDLLQRALVALARGVAAALAERQALEAVVSAAREFLEGLPGYLGQGELYDAIAALDAARR